MFLVFVEFVKGSPQNPAHRSMLRFLCLLQEKGQYDVAARHGVGPWKQGLLCAVLAAAGCVGHFRGFSLPVTTFQCGTAGSIPWPCVCGPRQEFAQGP